MSRVEVDALQDASKVAGTMLGSNLIGPLINASNRLHTNDPNGPATKHGLNVIPGS